MASNGQFRKARYSQELLYFPRLDTPAGRC